MLLLLPLLALPPPPPPCQAASVRLMSSKDARLSLMAQLLGHMGVVKALAWEDVLGEKVGGGVWCRVLGGVSLRV